MSDYKTDSCETKGEAARPPLPPFTGETAIQKVRLAEDAWNTRDPQKVDSPTRLIPVGGIALNFRMGAKKSFNF